MAVVCNRAKLLFLLNFADFKAQTKPNDELVIN